MALDENIYKLRLEKLQQIASLGQPAYPRNYDLTHAIPQVLADYSGKTAEQLADPRVNLRIAGRIMAIRLMGKAGFAHLQQGGKQLQIYVKKDAVGDRGFELYKLLDLGDHIGVTGYLFRTRTGELSVHVEELTFLSKDLLPTRHRVVRRRRTRRDSLKHLSADRAQPRSKSPGAEPDDQGSRVFQEIPARKSRTFQGRDGIRRQNCFFFRLG